MDRKSILVLIVTFLLLMAWYPLMNRLYPPKPVPPRTNQVVQITNTSLEPGSPTTPTSNLPPVVPPRLSASNAAWTVPSTPEEIVHLENDWVRYAFSSHGGGLKLIELKKYPETVGRKKKGVSNNQHVATLNTKAPVPVMTLLGEEALQGDHLYRLSQTANGIRAEKRMPNGLRIIKDFVLSSNYLFQAVVRLENQSSNALVIGPQEHVVGTATPVNPYDNAMMMGLYWYDGRRSTHIDQSWFANRTLGCFPGVPRTEFLAGDGNSNVMWTAVHNQFFTVAAVPGQGAPRVVARQVDLPAPEAEELKLDSKLVAKPFGYQTALIYPGAELAAGQAVERSYTFFAGPREYNTLARLGADMGNNLDLVMDFGGFFGFFAKILLLSMNGLHAMHLSYGWSIIAITVIIKLLFWPLTNASTRSMKRMAALQPQMKALQEKYKDDPKKMNAKLMEFMKEHRVSPMSGCFPIVLQIPVFFGFYKMLQSAIELRGASFLWARDLSQPDTIWTLPGLEFPINPLPLLMGATMLWQSHLTPPSPGMDPMQQKIMKYMPLMFIVFLYNFSAGLSLYWTVQNLLSIAQMKLTKNVTEAAGAPASVVPAPRGFMPNKKRK
ncbi:MAG TPA: membrane protein insertase YidC [Candidatus Paceibacterota bacterium]|nr:membrane protein insertase YidC [Candidatus Paceibacterota bacterium]